MKTSAYYNVAVWFVVGIGVSVCAVADLRGGARDAGPPPGSKFFQFHAVFGKLWQNRMLAPSPGELAPPPRGNPGSATDVNPSV